MGWTNIYPYDRWYVRRAEQYIKAFPGQSLDQHCGENVQSYLEEIGRKQKLADWQYMQVVRAIEVLFLDVLSAPWAKAFDWQYWRDSARSLGSGVIST